MKTRFTMLLIVALLSVTAIGFSQGIVDAQQETDTTSVKTISINPEEIDPTYIAEPDIKIPVLTEEEEKMALDIAFADPRVQQLIAEKAYEVCAIGVVHTSELVKTGAGILICLDKAYEIEYDWPYTTYNDELSTLEDQSFHEKLSVQTLRVIVNFQEGKVQVISPLSQNINM